MKRFIIADGVIQGILAMAYIIYVPCCYYFREYTEFSSINLVFVLFGWQLFSSLLHILKKDKLPMNRYLYALQLILAGYSVCIGVTLINTTYMTESDGLAGVFYYLFFAGVATLMPMLMIGIAFLTIKRLFIPLQQAV